ncbi:DUF6572 domain-containing protein [Gilliamella sp. Bif1-4]|uniref:DUF6572 domain-containing protein n=1 Tax=Gilliamella sp. Bif1-4 TaxID=3120233 RepID=UPI00080E25E0|nr:DUF6572 domain-containing protein [Gilliamella apicola]OCG41486.1 hypothetical protein A9G25_06255 [Gilliamella apicola]
MTIEDLNKVDMIGIPKENESIVSLGFTDHLSWHKGKEIEEHLFLIQEKINSYIRFVESGEIYKSFPAAKGRDKFLIEICFKYKIPKECLNFLMKVNEFLFTSELNIQISYKEWDNM